VAAKFARSSWKSGFFTSQIYGIEKVSGYLIKGKVQKPFPNRSYPFTASNSSNGIAENN
jgi:hypothetical protein